MRRLRERSAIPVVMLSARGRPQTACTGSARGPTTTLRSHSRRQNWWFGSRRFCAGRRRRRRPMRGPHLADLEIDLDRMEVRRGTQRLALTPVEFRLLAALVSARGRVLTRQALLDVLYGQSQGDALERTVDVHIGRLRDKLTERVSRSPLHRHRAGRWLPREMRVARSGRRPLARLATRMSLSTLAVALLAIGVLAVGVLIVARSSFDGLMIKSGASAAEAQTMFDRGVAEIFGIAVVVAVIVSAVLSVIVALHLTRPLDDMADAARRIAAGDYGARFHDRPGGDQVPLRFVQSDGVEPRRPGASPS